VRSPIALPRSVTKTPASAVNSDALTTASNHVDPVDARRVTSGPTLHRVDRPISKRQDDVVTRAPRDAIRFPACLDPVISQATGNDVAAATSVEAIVSAAASKQVFAVVCLDKIRPGSAGSTTTSANASAGWDPPQQLGAAPHRSAVSVDYGSDGVWRVAWGAVGLDPSLPNGVWVADARNGDPWRSQQVVATSQPSVSVTDNVLAWTGETDPTAARGRFDLQTSRQVAGAWSAPQTVASDQEALAAPRITPTATGFLLATRREAIEIDAAPVQWPSWICPCG
jgi:hypothetical protein